eukprot:348809_1
MTCMITLLFLYQIIPYFCHSYQINCNADSTCIGSTIQCHANENCIISCGGDYSCKNSNINCPDSYTCTVRCAGDYSCKKANIYAHKSSMDVICGGDYSCGSAIIDGRSSLGFNVECIGYSSCGNTIQYYPTTTTILPTKLPTLPTQLPTKSPTNIPTINPTSYPTNIPTEDPTLEPTVEPTLEPTTNPTPSPTINPTPAPTNNPTDNPSYVPTTNPTPSPTHNEQELSEPTMSPTLTITKITESFDGAELGNIHNKYKDNFMVQNMPVLIGVLLTIIAILSYIVNKYVYKNDLYHITAIVTASLHVLDMISDVLFSVQTTGDPQFPSSVSIFVIFIGSIIFIVLP